MINYTLTHNEWHFFWIQLGSMLSLFCHYPKENKNVDSILQSDCFVTKLSFRPGCGNGKLQQFLLISPSTEAAAQRCSVKKVFLEISQNLQENTRVTVSFLIKLQAEDCNFIKEESLIQVFFCEFWEIFKNTFFYRTPPVAPSAFKCYLHWKTIFAILQLMYNERFFYMKIKNNVVFSRYLDFCVFDESTNL